MLGELPDWYPLLRAARYMGVAPWDLYERPVHWTIWAITSENAENEAQDARIKQQQQSGGG